MFGYIMFIEKSETKEELLESLNIIIKSTRNREKLEELANIISYLLDNVLDGDIQAEMLEKINRKAGEKEMSTLYDRLLAENRSLIKQGKKEGQRKIVKNMINKKIDDEIILETTGIKKEELEEIKNKLSVAN